MLNLGNYSPTGQNSNCNIVTDDKGTRYLSYNTVIAFDYEGTTHISKNKWSKTTGRHKSYVKQYCSNWKEVPHMEFEKLYAEVFGATYSNNYNGV